MRWYCSAGCCPSLAGLVLRSQQFDSTEVTSSWWRATAEKKKFGRSQKQSELDGPAALQ